MDRHLMVKICGMREADNIRSVLSLSPDFMGMIFYPKSSRYVGDEADAFVLSDFSPVIKTGVFVNEDYESIMCRVQTFSLRAVQLHGGESIDLCRRLKENGLIVLKAFSVDDAFDFSVCEPYAPVCDYFVFDKATKSYGGSGQKFDWSVLQNYRLTTPYLLSGGIGVEDIPEVKHLTLNGLVGVDLNSRFEDAPALKNVEKVRLAIEQIKSIE